MDIYITHDEGAIDVSWRNTTVISYAISIIEVLRVAEPDVSLLPGIWNILIRQGLNFTPAGKMHSPLLSLNQAR